MDSGRYFRLNATATDLWKLLTGPASLDDLVSRLGEQYEGTRDAIAADVHEALDAMSEAGLILVEKTADGAATAG
jgi:hypothetical protein